MHICKIIQSHSGVSDDFDCVHMNFHTFDMKTTWIK